MPKTNSDPEKLRPFIRLGLDLSYSGSSDANGDCPFCEGSGKLYISQEKSLYHCKTCGGGYDGKGGNIYTFMRRLHEESISQTPLSELEMVAEERRLLVEDLIEDGLVKSMIDGEWLLPTYSLTKDLEPGLINCLYRWTSYNGGKRRLMCLDTFKAQLFGNQFWNPKKPRAFITEGRWDGISLRRTFRSVGYGSKLFRTEDEAKSLYNQCNVVSAPGAETFQSNFVNQFRGKDVAILFDNDHPRVNSKTGKEIPPAGIEGAKRVAKMLRGVARSIQVLLWGGEEEGYIDKSLPDGCDIRDLLTAAE